MTESPTNGTLVGVNDHPHQTTIGVPKEIAPGERRVAMVPDVVGRLVSTGLEVVVEAGAGSGALIPDELYAAAGGRIADDAWNCDAVVKLAGPTLDEVAQLREGSMLIGFLAPLSNPELIDALAARGVTAFAMELIPRISRAQAMDALSSQAGLAGYKAVILAAERATRLLPMMTTAAGTLPPGAGDGRGGRRPAGAGDRAPPRRAHDRL